MILADENNREMLDYILEKEKQHSFTKIPNKKLFKSRNYTKVCK